MFSSRGNATPESISKTLDFLRPKSPSHDYQKVFKPKKESKKSRQNAKRMDIGSLKGRSKTPCRPAQSMQEAAERISAVGTLGLKINGRYNSGEIDIPNELEKCRYTT